MAKKKLMLKDRDISMDKHKLLSQAWTKKLKIVAEVKS